MLMMADTRRPSLLALDDALDQLRKVDAGKCQIVEFGFYGG